MRVVAGKYRGKNLVTPKDDSVRPTTTRIKETLFNVLQGWVSGASVLDLFAGCGSLGIECISRGAKDVTFVDRSKDSVSFVYQNLKGVDGEYRVVNADFASVLRSSYVSGKKYDLIFLDPPYATMLGELAIDLIVELDLLSEDGIIVFEHGSEKTYRMKAAGFKQRTKKMGTITAEFISRKSVALMAGSFDPFTKGHESVLDEALAKYDEVWVACLVNPDKKYTFTPAQRLAIVQAVCEFRKGAHALYSEKYCVEVAKEVGATVLVRGVRDAKDIPYEEDMARYNKDHGGLDTEFISPTGFEEISSTLVRDEIAKGDYHNMPACAVSLLQSKQFADLK